MYLAVMTSRSAPLLAAVVIVGVPTFVVACREAGPPPVAPQTEPSAGSNVVQAPSASASPVAVVQTQEPPTGSAVAVAQVADPPPETPPKAVSAAACKAILKRSEPGFRSAIAGTKRTCSADADCTQVRATCLPGCSGDAFSAKDKDTYAKLSTAPLADCDKFDAGLCTVSLALPIPSCPQYLPRCDHGTCVSKPR